MIPSQALHAIWRKKAPRQLVIQLTDHCNALCPQCGMRRTNSFPRSKLSLDEIKRILDAAAQKKIKIVSFTGGEPLLFLDELSILIKHAGAAGIPYIRTGTNGFTFVNPHGSHFQKRVTRVAETLAATPLRNFWISIDSAVPSVHEKMRGFPGVIEGIEKALPIFHSHGIFPSANLGINRNMGGAPLQGFTDFPSVAHTLYIDFREAFKRFYRFVIDMGFTIVNTCYPMSVHENSSNTYLTPVYAATSDSLLVNFSDAEKVALFQALMDTVPKFRSQIRIFSPMSSLYALRSQYGNDAGKKPYPCRGGVDYFFISCEDANTYPCGYRGLENLGKFWELDIEGLDRDLTCHQCDWECFRDPSELFGPLFQALSSPIGLIGKMRRDGHFFRLWAGDIRYYRACGFFNGRKPPDYHRLRRFNRN